jgi:hypothetical protein
MPLRQLSLSGHFNVAGPCRRYSLLGSPDHWICLQVTEFGPQLTASIVADMGPGLVGEVVRDMGVPLTVGVTVELQKCIMVSCSAGSWIKGGRLCAHSASAQPVSIAPVPWLLGLQGCKVNSTS